MYWMSPLRQKHLATIMVLSFLTFSLLSIGIVHAQSSIPQNSHAISYGEGWECDWGFRKSDAACDAVAVPPNAHLDSVGNRWVCDRGYRGSNNSCTAIVVPENAYLLESRYGIGWACERGYRAETNACKLIVIPSTAI
jgi:hypothetical protein